MADEVAEERRRLEVEHWQLVQRKEQAHAEEMAAEIVEAASASERQQSQFAEEMAARQDAYADELAAQQAALAEAAARAELGAALELRELHALVLPTGGHAPSSKA